MDRVRRYPSDLTDAGWEIIEPMLSLTHWMGRPEKHACGAVIDAILYVVHTGGTACGVRILCIEIRAEWTRCLSRRWRRTGHSGDRSSQRNEDDLAVLAAHAP
ncbi:hypothetical protein DKT68_13665 [Micromonospora acroterricola]|uniref:Insertion element IS402-like domain-containing protein n=1 Tax=Micromonospora acroterricola TaxID=2202421 RepID=A0A317D3W0_9ACTN|nr:hypothetical protein DKT68_13665 [Micromonospora acroterricola]